MKSILNFRSVSVRGAFNFSRARVLWYDGLLRVYGLDGLVLEEVSNEPQAKRGYLKSWVVKTSRGIVTLRNKCMACGGMKWRRVYNLSNIELWDSA